MKNWEGIKTPPEILEKIKGINTKNATDEIYIKIRNEKGYKVLESRYVLEKNKGKIPEDFFVHHINRNKKDNRIENLQLVSRKEHGFIHRKKLNKNYNVH